MAEKMPSMVGREDQRAVLRFVAWSEVQAKALAAVADLGRAILKVPSTASRDVPFSAPGWGFDPNNPVENPLVPEWDEDFLKELLAQQEKAADFFNTCTQQFEQRLQNAQGMTDLQVKAHLVAEALAAYQQCLTRPHPQRIFPSA